MIDKFIDFLRNLEEASLRTATDAEMKKLQDISDGRLPKELIEIYSKAMPENEIEYEDFVFYGIDRIYDENISGYVPGDNIYPLGLFTFASTFDGDAICVDLNDENFPVYQCSHSLLCDDTKIFYYKGDEDITLEFNYENVIKISPKLADTLSDFLDKLINGNAETYSVQDMIQSMS